MLSDLLLVTHDEQIIIFIVSVLLSLFFIIVVVVPDMIFIQQAIWEAEERLCSTQSQMVMLIIKPCLILTLPISEP